jgi:hypothetical protein
MEKLLHPLIGFLCLGYNGFAAGDETPIEKKEEAEEASALLDHARKTLTSAEGQLEKALEAFYSYLPPSPQSEEDLIIDLVQSEALYADVLFWFSRSYEEASNTCHAKALQVESDPALIVAAEAFCRKCLQMEFLYRWGDILAVIEVKWNAPLPFTCAALALESIPVLTDFQASPVPEWIQQYWKLLGLSLQEQEIWCANFMEALSLLKPTAHACNIEVYDFYDYPAFGQLRRISDISLKFWGAFVQIMNLESGQFFNVLRAYCPRLTHNGGCYAHTIGKLLALINPTPYQREWEQLLRESIVRGNLGQVKILWLWLRNPNPSEYFFYLTDFHSLTQLGLAVLYGHTHIANFFVEQGAPIAPPVIRTPDGFTLHLQDEAGDGIIIELVEWCKLPIAKQLLKRGYITAQQSLFGWALRENQKDFLTWMLEHAQVDLTPPEWGELIHRLQQRGYADALAAAVRRRGTTLQVNLAQNAAAMMGELLRVDESLLPHQL